MSKLRDRMIHDMQLRGYGERTQEAYVRTVRQLQQFYDLSPEAISEDQLRDYFIHRKNVSIQPARSREESIITLAFCSGVCPSGGSNIAPHNMCLQT